MEQPAPVSPDSKEEEKLSLLHPELAKRARVHLAACRMAGLNVCVFEGLRTMETQASYYAKGRDAAGNVVDPKKVVTKAKPGQSLHQYALAYDVAFDADAAKPGVQWTWAPPPAKWAQVGALGKQCGLEWAGDWKSFPETPHFQMSLGLTWQGCLAIFRTGGLAAVWAEVDRRLAAA